MANEWSNKKTHSRSSCSVGDLTFTTNLEYGGQPNAEPGATKLGAETERCTLRFSAGVTVDKMKADFYKAVGSSKLHISRLDSVLGLKVDGQVHPLDIEWKKFVSSHPSVLEVLVTSDCVDLVLLSKRDLDMMRTQALQAERMDQCTSSSAKQVLCAPPGTNTTVYTNIRDISLLPTDQSSSPPRLRRHSTNSDSSYVISAGRALNSTLGSPSAAVPPISIPPPIIGNAQTSQHDGSGTETKGAENVLELQTTEVLVPPPAASKLGTPSKVHAYPPSPSPSRSPRRASQNPTSGTVDHKAVAVEDTLQPTSVVSPRNSPTQMAQLSPRDISSELTLHLSPRESGLQQSPRNSESQLSPRDTVLSPRDSAALSPRKMSAARDRLMFWKHKEAESKVAVDPGLTQLNQPQPTGHILCQQCTSLGDLVLHHPAFRILDGDASDLLSSSVSLGDPLSREPWYKDFFTKDHVHFFGKCEEGEFIASLLYDEETKTMRLIFRTKKNDYKVFLDCSVLKSTPSVLKLKKWAQLIKTVNLPTIKKCKAQNKPGLQIAALNSRLRHFEDSQIQQNNCFRIGVIYCRFGQTSEAEILNNEKGSEQFQQFLDTVGTRIELQGWGRYRAGLDIHNNETGIHSVFTEFQGVQIMFHVSTLLPHKKIDPQQG
ncbi:rap1 GTPase-activating protein 2 [Pelomyxa schiedti]|nr:rap1 GTPase-activating protein 2 [Pelomyxa schiedti]